MAPRVAFGAALLAAFAVMAQPTNEPTAPAVNASPPGVHGAGPCPAGMTPTGDGYCLAAGEKYCGGGLVCTGGLECRSNGRCFHANGCFPDQIDAGRSCMPAGSVKCSGTVYCDPGQYCTGPNTCGGGAPATGPMCGNLRAPEGNLCNPFTGNSYNPRIDKLCGSAVCDLRMECGDNACLSPYRQSAAVRQQ